MLLVLMSGIGLGVVTMYAFDPTVGRSRRSRARDKLIHFQKTARQAAAVTARDLKNRTVGTLAEGRAAMFGGAVDDAVLAGRVRSKLGFLVRHPSAIEVQVSDGRVTLSGPVLSDEVQPLVRGIAAVRGMRILENRLEVHESAEEVHRLQGPATRPTGQRIDLLQSHWSPSTRFLVASSAAFLLLNANRHRISLAPLAALASVGYLLYGLSQEESAPASQGDSRAQAEVTAGGTG